MKSYKQFLEDTSTQQCPEGKYFCHKEKKCMPIPRGYYVGAKGWLNQRRTRKMGPITVTEMAMDILAMVMVGTATVVVAMVVEND